MTWAAYQDGDQYYIQDDPESEDWIASFSNKTQADQYCNFLNAEENTEDWTTQDPTDNPDPNWDDQD